MSQRSKLRSLIRSGRIVVKIGSGVLTDAQGRLEPKTIRRLSSEIAPIIGLRRWPYVVSSGAIAVGMGILGLKERPRTMAGLQSAAAVGQSKLVEAWSQGFRKYEVPVAQVLLTHADLADRKRFLNARRALGELERNKALAIINENDSVSFEEIAFGDNDELAAQVCNLVDAQLLIMLSTAPGILDQEDERISEITADDAILDQVARPGGSRFGTGGMLSKIRSARAACARGAHVAILPGDQPGAIEALLSGEDVGTLVVPGEGQNRLRSRAHWIAHTLRPAGTLVLDAGATEAVQNNNKSLLPAGVRGLHGEFKSGDAVDLVSFARPDEPFARGLCRYSSAQMHRIIDSQSHEIFALLGHKKNDPVIHRDDLVLLNSGENTALELSLE